MALEEKYVKVFQKECNYLSFVVLDNLRRLSQEPQNEDYLARLVQSADIMIGDSRFVDDTELEQAATKLVKTFTGIHDASNISDELKFLTHTFERINARYRD
jgi:chemotaxis protein histidine kinase CheA